MTRDDIIRMARQTGMHERVKDGVGYVVRIPNLEKLERFAALVAAAERNRMKAEGWRQCAVGQHTTQFCGQLEAAVKAEQNRICKIVHGLCISDNNAREIVTAIREEEDK